MTLRLPYAAEGQVHPQEEEELLAQGPAPEGGQDQLVTVYSRGQNHDTGELTMVLLNCMEVSAHLRLPSCTCVPSTTTGL